MHPSVGKLVLVFVSIPSSFKSLLFLFLCSLVYSSIGFSHGKGGYPWRATQQESIHHGWLPAEVWILKRSLPIHLSNSFLSQPCCVLTLLPVVVHSCFFFPSILFPYSLLLFNFYFCPLPFPLCHLVQHYPSMFIHLTLCTYLTLHYCCTKIERHVNRTLTTYVLYIEN